MAKVSATVTAGDAGQHEASSGLVSSRCIALRNFSWPESVKASAFRPLRVGITQSNRSIPRATLSNRSIGRANSHQVARLVFGKGRAGSRGDPIHLRGCLSHTQAADGITFKVHCRQVRWHIARAVRYRVLPGRWRSAPGRRDWPPPGIAGPNESISPSRLRLAPGLGGQGDDVIKHHGNITAKCFLDLNGMLGGQIERSHHRYGCGKSLPVR